MAEPSTPASSERIRAFDWLRGLAVLVMIQTHALVLLRPEHQQEPWYGRLVRLDGLVAPSFIFTAGFALALVQVRGALKGALGPQLRKSFTRAGEVLLVAELVNLAWFPLWRAPWYLLRIDILHCIALSLFLALGVMAVLARRPRLMRWVMLALALGLFALAPLAEGVTGWPALFVNNSVGVLDAHTGATFPLLPWAGYVFLGASAGATAAYAPHALDRWLLLLLGVGGLLWWQERALEAAYPPHHFWVTNPANAAQRWALVVAAVLLLRAVERRSGRAPGSRAARLLTAFGTASLSAYFFHEMLLFFPSFRLFSFAMYWREACDWGGFWALDLALTAMTFGCMQAWARLEPKVKARLTSWGARPRAAS